MRYQPADYRALPRRFRQKRLLIIGCGDIGQRIAALASKHWRVYGVARSEQTAGRIREAGAVPLRVDAGARQSRVGDRQRRLQDLADWVIHSAPPPQDSPRPDRQAIDRLTRAWTARLLRPALRRSRSVALEPLVYWKPVACRKPLDHGKRLVYLSTTGVYGDRQGQRVSEVSGVQPLTERAERRVDAEKWLRRIGSVSRRLRVSVLRVPGIYAFDRLPLERLRARLPALLSRDDVQTNHIHADDLARMTRAALFRGRAQRTLNIVDDTGLLMGDYLDTVARWAGLPSPTRVDRQTLIGMVTPMRASFMSESRQLCNLRMKRELRLQLRYPTVADFLASCLPPSDRARLPI